MIVTMAALGDKLYFPDRELHGATQIPELDNIINIFHPAHSTTNLREVCT